MSLRVALLNGAAIPTPPPDYGSEIVTAQLATSLAAMGVEVHLFAPGGSVAPPGVRLHYMPGTYGEIRPAWDAYPWEVYGDLLRRCDMVHDLSGSAAVIERMAIDAPDHPRLFTRNGIDFSYPRFGRHNAVVLSSAAKQCALTGTSAWHDTEYPQWDRDPGTLSDCRVVPYGIPTAFYRPQGGVGDYILYVGRPHPAKGVDRILEIARRMPEVPFVLAWRPALADHQGWAERYAAQAADLPNVEIVLFPRIDHHLHKWMLYSQARAFLQPTRYIEAFGLTAIEAMACGTPVILADRGSAPEIVKPGVTGFLCRDHEHYADYRAAIMAAGKMDRRRIRQEAVESFDTQVMAGRYLALYAEIIGGGGW